MYKSRKILKMEENEEMIQPKDKFYLCTIVIDGEDPNTGKPKKTKEIHLVDAACPTEAEKKIKKVMEGTIFSWKIVTMAENKIQFVY